MVREALEIKEAQVSARELPGQQAHGPGNKPLLAGLLLLVLIIGGGGLAMTWRVSQPDISDLEKHAAKWATPQIRKDSEEADSFMEAAAKALEAYDALEEIPKDKMEQAVQAAKSASTAGNALADSLEHSAAAEALRAKAEKEEQKEEEQKISEAVAEMTNHLAEAQKKAAEKAAAAATALENGEGDGRAKLGEAVTAAKEVKKQTDRKMWEFQSKFAKEKVKKLQEESAKADSNMNLKVAAFMLRHWKYQANEVYERTEHNTLKEEAVQAAKSASTAANALAAALEQSAAASAAEAKWATEALDAKAKEKAPGDGQTDEEKEEQKALEAEVEEANNAAEAAKASAEAAKKAAEEAEVAATALENGDGGVELGEAVTAAEEGNQKIDAAKAAIEDCSKEVPWFTIVAGKPKVKSCQAIKINPEEGAESECRKWFKPGKSGQKVQCKAVDGDMCGEDKENGEQHCNNAEALRKKAAAAKANEAPAKRRMSAAEDDKETGAAAESENRQAK